MAWLFVLYASFPIRAQISSYQLTPSITSFVPVSGGTRISALEDDNAIGFISIPFTFEVEGVPYTALKASSDGFITFNTSVVTSINYNQINNVLKSHRPLIAPLWDNLDGSATFAAPSKFEHIVTGTTPNRVLTMEWLNWEWSAYADTAVISFQVKLYETTNQIEFIYRQESGNLDYPSASIGLAGSNSFLSLLSTSTAPLTSSLTADNTLSKKPASGQSYLFTPPTCPAPSSLLQTNADQSSIDLKWVSGGATHVQIEYGAVGHAPGSGTFITSTASQHTITGLPASSCYDVYLRDSCGPGDSSSWLGPIQMCTAWPAPYFEDYDANPSNTPVIPGKNALYYANGWASISNSYQPEKWQWVPSHDKAQIGQDHTSGTGNFVYGNSDFGFNGDTTWLYSPFIDLTSLSNAGLRLWFHKNGSFSLADIILEADTNGSGNWITLDDTSMVGISHQGPAPSDPWKELILPLNGFQNVVRFRLYQKFAFCCGVAAIDDFEVFEIYNDDLKAAQLIEPVDGKCSGQSSNVTVEVQNLGTSTITSFDIAYQVNGASPVIETVNQTILPFQNYTYTFNQQLTLQGGTENIVSWIILNGDMNVSNDTLADTAKIEVARVFNDYFYLYGFENGKEGWTSEGTNNSWEIGTPAASYINAAANGTQAAVTNLNGSYNGNEDSYLVSPCFDFSRFTSNPTFGFNHIYNLEQNFDYSYVEVSTDGGQSWNLLGQMNSGTNWYNKNGYWDGDSPGGNGNWDIAQHEVSGVAGKQNVRFRVGLYGDFIINYEGVGLDDVFLVVPPNDLFPDTVSACGQPTLQLDAGNIYPDTVVDYLWSNGDTTPSTSIKKPGTYTVTITNTLSGTTTTEVVEVVFEDAPHVIFATDVDTIDYFGLNAAIYPEPKFPADFKHEWIWTTDTSNFSFFIADPVKMGVGLHDVVLNVTNNYHCSGSGNHQVFVSDFVGIDEQSSYRFSYFPNPAKNQLNIQVEAEYPMGLVEIEITDMNGKSCLSELFYDNQGTFRKTLNITSLAKGIYLLRVQNGDEQRVNKLVVD